MKLMVRIWTMESYGILTVEAPTIPDAFMKIPLEAANKGLALMNDGSANAYEVKVIEA